MARPLRLVPGADDFLTDRINPLEQTVEIPRYRPLPPVPMPVRRQRARFRRDLQVCVLLFAAALAAVIVAIAVAAPQLLEAVRP